MNDIDVNNKELSDEEALKHKNFDKVLKGTKGSGSGKVKVKVVVGGLAVLAILAVYAVVSSGDGNENEAGATVPSEMSKSNPSYNAKYSSPTNEGVGFVGLSAVVKSNEELVVQTASGTKITIPANTLIDGDGELVQGDVVLKYREFLNQKDIFQSGIPMLYKEGTEERVFESGGMFELLAYQNDKPIYIAPDKLVQVDLASKQVGDNFNVYYYSANDSTWIDKGKDKHGFSAEQRASVDSLLRTGEVYAEVVQIEKESKSAAERLSKIQKSKPIAPVVAAESKPSFTIEVNYKHFPELQAMHGVKFQVSDKETNFKPAYASEIWNSATISRGDESNEFFTCFENIKQGEKCFLTNPVIEKQNLAMANKRYDVLMETYLFKKDSAVKRLAWLKERMAKRVQKLAELRIVALNNRNVPLSQALENTVTRRFQIENFGIWNSDCAQKLPSEAIVKAKFVDEAGTPLMFHRMYLVLKDKNMVITLYPEIFKKGIPYNPGEDCMLWAVTPDLKNVAVFNTSQFKSINKSHKTHTFDMKLVSSDVFDKYSVEAIFNI
jgi:hypothetical protein